LSVIDKKDTYQATHDNSCSYTFESLKKMITAGLFKLLTTALKSRNEEYYLI